MLSRNRHPARSRGAQTTQLLNCGFWILRLRAERRSDTSKHLRPHVVTEPSPCGAKRLAGPRLPSCSTVDSGFCDFAQKDGAIRQNTSVPMSSRNRHPAERSDSQGPGHPVVQLWILDSATSRRKTEEESRRKTGEESRRRWGQHKGTVVSCRMTGKEPVSNLSSRGVGRRIGGGLDGLHHCGGVA